MNMNKAFEKTLKAFQIIKKLDEGKFGAIFQARYTPDHKLYTLKQIHTDAAELEKDPPQLAAICNDMKQFFAIDDPYIIRQYEHFYEEKQLNIVSEYCEGGDLNAFLHQSTSPNMVNEGLIWKFLTDLSLGLDYLHTRNVVYKNLTTKTVLLTDDHYPKLSDLGLMPNLAKAITNVYPYPPSYPAPEIVKGEPITTKTDMWDLGCVLYEMCALKALGVPTTPEKIFEKIDKDDLSLVSNGCSPKLAEIILRCLSRNSAERFSTKEILDMPVIQESIKQDKEELENMNRMKGASMA